MRKLDSISRRKFGILMGAKLCLLATKSHGQSPPSEHVVTIHRFKFLPSELEITAGDTVVWENRDSAPHTATAQDED
jgi:plastocyanin